MPFHSSKSVRNSLQNDQDTSMSDQTYTQNPQNEALLDQNQAEADRITQMMEEEEEEVQMKSEAVAQKEGEEEEEVQMKSEAVTQKEGEEEEEVQMKSEAVAQKEGEEEEEMQMKSASSSASTLANSPSKSHELPPQLQAQAESVLGEDLSQVKIKESEQAREVGALAYTQGNELTFAPGQFQPQSKQGQELIGHELAHVQQQKQGRVQATTQTKGLPVNDDPALEKEADVIGEKIAGEEVETGLKKKALNQVLR
ncbi:MAG: DUF4157 domain-containing protein [Bacteroidota bacterium]